MSLTQPSCFLCRGADEDQNFDYCRGCGRVAAGVPSGPGYKIGHDNREAVREYFLNHVGITRRECAKALGLSEMAVGRHIATLRSEWLGRQL